MNRLEESLEVLGEVVETLSEKKEKSKGEKLKDKFMNPKTGRFKGSKGQRFKNCEAYFKAKGGIENPAGLCAKIYRQKSGMGEDVVDEANEVLDETLSILAEYKRHAGGRKMKIAEREPVGGKVKGHKKITHGKHGKSGCK